MKLVITGSTGFIGKAIVSTALNKGYTVAVLVRPDSNISNLEKYFGRVKIFTYTDLNNHELTDEIRKWNPNTFYHIAWKGVAGDFRNEPYQFIDNIKLTLDTVILASKTGCTKWIGAGSQAEYGLHSGIIKEESLCKPYNAYGKAKLAASIAALGMCEIMNIEGAWGRIFSTYGPDDYPNYFIPYVISSFSKNISPELSKCEQLWDYLYVSDAAEAFLSIAENNCSGIFNIGSGKVTVLKDVVEKIKLLMGKEFITPQYGAKPYAQNQVMHLEADMNKLISATGWQPQTNLEEGLKQTINFQTSNL